MTKRLLFAFLVLALTVACAKTYWVTFFQPSVVAGAEFKPGEYRLDLNGDKATIGHGKLSVRSAVQVVENGTKYSATSVRYANGDGKYLVKEIRLVGTRLKLVFN